jgi:two-component system, OmpR family, sensor kinase
MRRTLFTRFATVICVLFAISGMGFVVLTVLTARRYADETNQQLQHDLAQRLMASLPRGVAGPPGREDLLKFLESVMVINPTIEAYLVDGDGTLNAYVVPEDSIRRRQIDLAPVQRFLDGGPAPILGDDPRSDRNRKVFSVARVTSLQLRDQNGYLYVILGGQAYESVMQALRGSYILRLSVWVLGTSLIVWVSAALVSFNVLTRRLSRLMGMMARFEQSGFTQIAGDLRAPDRDRDEIDRLTATFKMMCERIVDLLARLKAHDSARRQFIADVAHDLKAPLVTLQAHVQTLSENHRSLAPAERRNYLDVLSRQTKRLERLVSELLQLSVLEAEDMTLKTEPLALADLVQDVFLRFRASAEQRGVVLQLSLPDEPSYVEADISLIERVIENLIENALKHTGGAERVIVALGVHAGAATVAVTDTGHGITEQELPFIFDRTYRGAKALDAAGVGLGLAIAKRIVEMHGSVLNVTSTLGQGSTFSFTLPVVDPRRH